MLAKMVARIATVTVSAATANGQRAVRVEVQVAVSMLLDLGSWNSAAHLANLQL